MKTPIYLDNHATTPVDSRVVSEMLPYFTERFGNAASTSHSFGWEAQEACEIAAERVAALIGAKAPEIIWTSGTTESINLSLIGTAFNQNKKNHLITCVTEHRAVLETSKYLESQGWRVTFLPVDEGGIVDLDQVRDSITDKTLMISLMAANNEMGAIHPLSEVGKIAKEKGIYFHVDAAQGCGKIPLDVNAMGIDLMSMSGHKAYAPKGVGALYVRHRDPHVSIKQVIFGGTHQKGLRPGTLPVPMIVGMGKAFELAGAELASESEKTIHLRERLLAGLKKDLDRVFLNGHPTKRLPGNLNISFMGVSASDFLLGMTDVAVSSGSACRTGSIEPSYVLMSLGIGEERAKCSIRFGIGRFNTGEEIDYVVGRVVDLVRKLRTPS